MKTWRALAWEAGRLLVMALNREGVRRTMGSKWEKAADEVTDLILLKKEPEEVGE